jgi:hypothetical protein
VNRGQNTERGQRFRHAKRPDGIHVSGNDRHARPGQARMFKSEFTFQLNIRTAFEGRAFWADKNVFKTKLQIFFDTHVRIPGVNCIIVRAQLQ